VSVLVDSSVWIDYFRGRGNTDPLDHLIDENLVVTNDLILAELIPPLRVRRQRRVISLLNELERAPLAINWPAIIDLQSLCLRKGINKAGLPDLIIAQNVMQHGLTVYSFDKLFVVLGKHMGVRVYRA
jgi:predicted nucleic acid-binding protein